VGSWLTAVGSSIQNMTMPRRIALKLKVTQAQCHFNQKVAQAKQAIHNLHYFSICGFVSI